MQQHSTLSYAIISFLSAILLIAVQTNTQAQNVPGDAGAGAFERPAYNTNARYKENWSVLRDKPADAPGDLFDPIKYIPFNGDGSVWLSFGGQARIRYENWRNFNFDDSFDDDFTLYRGLFHADLHVGEHVRVFAQMKSAFSSDRDLPGGRRTLDVDSIDLQQGFGDLMLPMGEDRSLTLRGGRQELMFGAQRLVSPLDWSNTRRSWDGVSAIYEAGDWTVTGFWTQFVPVRKYEFNEADAHTQFWGVYAAGKIPQTAIGLDAYLLVLDMDDPVVYNASAGDEERYTAGGRIHGKVGSTGLDYDLEAAYQFGEVGQADVHAYMIGSQVGYTFGDWHGRPRVWVGLDYASGDDGTGGDVETFNQLFPLGHQYYGWIDTVARQNAIDWNAGVTLKPLAGVDRLDQMTLTIWGHLFQRASSSDALYNAGGGVVRPGNLSKDKDLGAEIDVLIRLPLDRHAVVLLGYSHFFTGDFIDESTPTANEDIDFFYMSLEYTF